MIQQGFGAIIQGNKTRGTQMSITIEIGDDIMAKFEECASKLGKTTESCIEEALNKKLQQLEIELLELTRKEKADNKFE